METYSLDITQRSVVESRSKTIMVSACPGAGKTRVLVYSIKQRVDEGANPRDIICATFTNAGAHELAERLGNIKLGYLGTLHGYCFRLLQRYGALLGYREGGINLVGEDLSLELLRAAGKRFNYKGSEKALIEARDPGAQLAHKHHQFEMKRSNLVNYDGVLREAITLLTKHSDEPSIRAQVLGKLLFGDEMQDSALADWEIYRLLQPSAAFFVGDDDQSIFSFRGAHPAGFKEAWDATPEDARLKLQTNYRSGVVICQAAERLIWNNRQRVLKRIVPTLDADLGQISFTQHSDDTRERNAIVGAIYSRISDGANPGDFAILCRTNRLAKQFKESLLLCGVPILGHVETKLPPDFGYAMDVLSLFADPRSDILAERVLKRIAPGKLSKAKEIAQAEGKWLSMAAINVGALNTISMDVSLGMVDAALAMNGISRETCELIGSRIALLPPDSTLADLRHDLFNADKWSLTEGKKDGVYCGTIHSFKGREANVVFLPGWEQGVLPSSRKDTDTEEERRLAFVAITRAAKECHISAAARRVPEFGPVKEALPSRFIEEAGL